MFTRTKHGADKVVRGLNKDGIAAEAIHGNKSQNQRERVLADFRNGRIRTLVATDIAARGIDVEGISHVINFDLPNIPESYVHRIGRTARAGAEGIAISLCSRDELPFLRDIEKLIRMQIPATGEARPRRPSSSGRSSNSRRTAQAARQQQRNGRGGRQRNGRGPDRNQDRSQDRNQDRNQRSQPGPQPAASGRSQNGNGQGQHRPAVQQHGEIASVAFMQPKPERPRQTATDNNVQRGPR